MAHNLTAAPERLHPGLWLASQLAQSSARCLDTGYSALSQELPGGGWPVGTQIDLLLAQPGLGELRLLRPALARMAKRPIVLLQTPQRPQILALAGLGLTPGQLIWIHTSRSNDALWAAEQILRSGSCGALLFWQNHVRGESLRRLHLAAQSGETLFCMMRPLSCAQDASPAPLRLSLRAAAGGVDIGFVKRRGPQRDTPLFVGLLPSPVANGSASNRHGVLTCAAVPPATSSAADQPVSAAEKVTAATLQPHAAPA